VLWPQDVKLPAEMTEHYPAQVPPLRGDRNTVLVGVGNLDQPAEVQLTAATAGGNQQTLAWTVNPSLSNDDNAFLATVVESAQKDGGVTLPAIGDEGLEVLRATAQARAQQLSQLAGIARAMNSNDNARRLAQGAQA